MRPAALAAAMALLAACGGAQRKTAPVVSTPTASRMGTPVGPGGAWTIEVVSSSPLSAEPRTERAGASPASFRIRDGSEWRTVPVPGPVPLAGAPVNRLSGWARDRDGTLYVTAQWSGNTDQANGIGVGIYRLAGNGAMTPVVDAHTPIPGRAPLRFNEIGLPNVDRGEVAFWAGRGGNDWSGVYLWSGGHVVTIADTNGPIVGEGTPALEQGAVAFVGRPANAPDRRGLYYWTRRHASPQRIAGDGDPISGGMRVADVVIADPVIEGGRVWFGVRGAPGRAETARILVWDGAAVRDAVLPDAVGAPGDVFIQTDHLAVAGDAVAFAAGVGAGGPMAIFVARGGRVEEVVRDGHVLPQGTLTRAFRIDDHGFTGTELWLGGVIAGRHHVLRATYRVPNGRASAAVATP